MRRSTLCKSGHSTRVHPMQKITFLHQSSTKQPIFPTGTIFDVRSCLTLLRLLVSLTPNPAHQRINIHRPQGASSIKRQGRCCVAPSFRYPFTPSFRNELQLRTYITIVLPQLLNQLTIAIVLNLTHNLSLRFSHSFPSLT